MSPLGKWMPPKRRDMPALPAAAEKVGQDRVTSLAGVPGLVGVLGSIREVPALTVTLAPKLSEPKKVETTRPPAALKVEWPDTYSGNGGVTTRSSW
jgi:hypothetical protein